MSTIELTDHEANDEALCPYCGKGADMALGGQKEPEPGDYVICAYCAGVGRYEEDLTIRRAAGHERARLMRDKVFQSMYDAVVKAILERKGME